MGKFYFPLFSFDLFQKSFLCIFLKPKHIQKDEEKSGKKDDGK